ncbi:MAG: 50S ribosomal protein L21 [Candidatus Pacebacteria bacterium]|nr:50S ribosomal protein L21 [Candidatus Paceibacterota bacterium]
MSKIAVIKTGGKQYKVKEGDKIKVEKLDLEENKSIKLDTLLIGSEDGKELTLGRPSLGDKVTAVVEKQARDKKITVIKYKNKTRYKRTLGHRQPFSLLKIEKIES